MEKRAVPGTDLRLSCLALGGWLTLGDRLDDASSLRLLHAAVDGGIDFLDLADVYGARAGGAERVAGAFLREVGRDRVLISSKVFWPTSEQPEDRGLSRRHVHASIDRTLARLGTDHVDLYFCHREDPTVPLAETVEAMGDLVRAGKVRAWGTSCWRPATLRAAHALARAAGTEPPRVEQPEYSLLERGIERDVRPCCAELRMGLVAFSPLAGGVLTGKYLDGAPAGSRGASSSWNESYLRPAAVRAVTGFVRACRERQVEPAVAALAWVLHQPGVTAAICGATSVAQLRTNLAAAAFAPADGWQWVERFFPAHPSLWRRGARWLARRWHRR